MELTPKRGAIAVCSLGTIGMITSDEPGPVTYPDGNRGVAWTGIHLGACEDGLEKKVQMKPGDLWSSRNPRVIADDFESFARFGLAATGAVEVALRWGPVAFYTGDSQDLIWVIDQMLRRMLGDRYEETLDMMRRGDSTFKWEEGREP